MTSERDPHATSAGATGDVAGWSRAPDQTGMGEPAMWPPHEDPGMWGRLSRPGWKPVAIGSGLAAMMALMFARRRRQRAH